MTELPPDIDALIAAERATPDPSTTVMQSVRAQVARSVAHVPLGHVVSGLATKLFVVALVVAAVGYGVVASHDVEGRALSWAQSVDASDDLFEGQVALAQGDAPPVAVTQSASVTKARRITQVAQAPAADVARLLTSAWRMLSAGDAEGSLRVVEQVEALNPHGPLEEERHALEVAALLALTRNEEARRSAERFIEQYPQSIHARLVRRALTPERRQ